MTSLHHPIACALPTRITRFCNPVNKVCLQYAEGAANAALSDDKPDLRPRFRMKAIRAHAFQPFCLLVEMSIVVPASRKEPSGFSREPLNKYQKWLYSVYTNRLQTETRPLSPFFIAHGAMFAPFGVL